MSDLCLIESTDKYVIWEGKWNSDNYSDAYGTISIPLKKINMGEYESEATITYEGCYNFGNSDEIKLKIVSTMIEMLNKKEVTYLEFSGYIGSHRIEYSISEYSDNKIVGIYKSYNPDDVGIIELFKTVKTKNVDPKNKQNQNKTSWCVIF